MKENTQSCSNELIFIPHNVPSLKNGKVKTSKGIFSSKTVKKYLTLLGIQGYSSGRKEVKEFKRRENEFRKIIPLIEEQMIGKTEPIKMGFHFVRNSKRDFDFNNANQLIADLLVAHDVIEDDCMRVFLPFPLEVDGRYYTVDKENPGVYIKIL